MIDCNRFQWQTAPTEKRGVICGAERGQEWLLPWWWERYTEKNRYPVTFVDFGMSDEMRTWCKERGDVVELHLDSDFIAPRAEIDPELAKQWEAFYGWTLWKARKTWFRKPFGLLHSRYQQTLWVDLDCEVLGSLEGLFNEAKEELAIVREEKAEHLFQPVYNGGVILFEHGTPLIQEWTRAAATKSHLFWGDDPVLSDVIHQMDAKIVELPEIYNWRLARGLNLNAVIVHWVGSGGKSYIRKHGGLKPAIDAFYQASRISSRS
ncbi:MAG: hypothetical protein JSS61_01300 [Verrucomicrobia bacterium]|nr:hypothetical protein [Verrucomicrobiota bacterium]